MGKELNEYTNEELSMAGGSKEEILSLRKMEAAYKEQATDFFNKENNWGGLPDKVFNEVEDLKFKVNDFYSEDTPKIIQPKIKSLKDRVKINQNTGHSGIKL
jgi:hypothetical protein